MSLCVRRLVFRFMSPLSSAQHTFHEVLLFCLQQHSSHFICRSPPHIVVAVPSHPCPSHTHPPHPPHPPTPIHTHTHTHTPTPTHPHTHTPTHPHTTHTPHTHHTHTHPPQQVLSLRDGPRSQGGTSASARANRRSRRVSNMPGSSVPEDGPDPFAPPQAQQIAHPWIARLAVLNMDREWEVAMGPGGVTVTSPGAPSAPAPALTRLSPSGALGPTPGSVSPHVGLAHPGRSPTWGESGGGARSPSFGQRRSPYSPGPEDRTGTSAPGGGGVGGAGPHPGSVSPSGSSGSGAGVGGGPDRVTAGPRSGVGPTSPGSTGPGRAGRPSPLHSVLLGGCAHASAISGLYHTTSSLRIVHKFFCLNTRWLNDHTCSSTHRPCIKSQTSL